MRILDQAFNGAKEYYFTDWCLQFTASCGRWFPELTPVNLVALRFMFDLPKHFWRHDICCHISGSFPTYLAGLQTGYHRVSFFIALKESPLINLIFQRGETQRDVFAIGRFHFTLSQNVPHADVCRYVVRRGTSEYYFTFLGIDSIIECDTRSNIDFIHFIGTLSMLSTLFGGTQSLCFPTGNASQSVCGVHDVTISREPGGLSPRAAVSARLAVHKSSLSPTA